MPTTKKMKRNNDRSVTEGHVREIAEDIVRVAIQEQARDLETHLKNIHERLIDLEKKRR